MTTKLHTWAIASHETPSGFVSPPVGAVRVQAYEGEEPVVTSRVVELLRDDQRVFKTKTGSVYELVGDPVSGWIDYAGSGGIDDFAPFDVTVFGVVFLDKPTRGRIKRQGFDWLWDVSLGKNGLWSGKCIEDKPMMCRVVEMEAEFGSADDAKAAAIKQMERLYKEAGGKRLFAAGGDLRVYVDEPC